MVLVALQGATTKSLLSQADDQLNQQHTGSLPGQVGLKSVNLKCNPARLCWGIGGRFQQRLFALSRTMTCRLRCHSVSTATGWQLPSKSWSQLTPCLPLSNIWRSFACATPLPLLRSLDVRTGTMCCWSEKGRSSTCIDGGERCRRSSPGNECLG